MFHPSVDRQLDILGQDLKFALRSLSRSPGFTITSLLVISLGIGAAAAVFSVTDRILFRQLPYRAGDQLVSFGMLAKVVDDGEFLFAADYKDFAESSTPFQSVTSWSGVQDCDITDGSAIRQRCAEVDWSFLQVLGVRPLFGSSFSPRDVQPGAPRKVMLAYGLWKSHFASEKTVVGKTLLLDGMAFRISGVLPESFELPTLQHVDLLTPQSIAAAGWIHGSTRVLRVIGRLKEGVGLDAAGSQLARFFNHILSGVPTQFRKEVQFRVRSLRDRQMGNSQLAAWTLLGAVLSVLLVSSANVANLLVARMASRQVELAIRAAIGVSRVRLVRQMLTESLLLALTGGVIGCGLAGLLLRVVVSAAPNGIPHLVDASLDRRVLAVSLAASLCVGILFGLAPAFQRPDTESLGSSRSVAPRASTKLKNILVALQIGLSSVLLAAAGLLVRSLWNLETQPLGMHTEHVLTAQLVLPASRYTKPAERIAFFNRVEQQLGAIPGIRAFGISDSLPPGGWERSRPFFSLAVVGKASHGTNTGGLVNWRYVSPGYFEALRIPILEGRPFLEEERRSGINQCILSRSLAVRLFPGRSAIGQRLRFSTNAPIETVGVVPDVKNTGLAVSDNPEYYIMRTHSPDDTYLNNTGPVAQRTLSILLRSPLSDTALAARVKREIAGLDSSIPVEIQSMQERLADLSAGPRFNAVLLLAFAAIGLFLAAAGLYGTVAYLVNQRTQEIGIRMALGATRAEIAQLMLAHSAKWTLTGVGLGMLLSLAATRLLSSLLFRVSAQDPLTLVATASCLFVVALVATANPALKAAAVDPIAALRKQ